MVCLLTELYDSLIIANSLQATHTEQDFPTFQPHPMSLLSTLYKICHLADHFYCILPWNCQLHKINKPTVLLTTTQGLGCPKLVHTVHLFSHKLVCINIILYILYTYNIYVNIL